MMLRQQTLTICPKPQIMCYACQAGSPERLLVQDKQIICRSTFPAPYLPLGAPCPRGFLRLETRRSHQMSKITKDFRVAADRKSTRLNSSHVAISYAVFCLKKKKKIN